MDAAEMIRATSGQWVRLDKFWCDSTLR